MDFEPGRLLAHYRLVEPLGAGGMGEVWKATDTTLDRDVAIKILPGALASNPERVGRFEREAKLLASLNHPGIAAIYGLHRVTGVNFLAMELVHGRTLTEAIGRGLSTARVLEIGEGIADALAAAHRKHVTHRDLKPDNIMLDAEGRPKVLDFGLAKLTDSAPSDAETLTGSAVATRQGTILGTAAYMSPEQARGRAVDPRSDVFSLGTILYEMATGQRPFSGGDTISVLTAILRDVPPPLTRSTPAAPLKLEAIVARCLAKDPADRYADAAELRDDLHALRQQLESGALKPISDVAAPRSKRLVRAALAALGLVVLAAGGWVLWQRNVRSRWVHEALPRLEGYTERIQGLEEGREAWDSYVLARQIDAVSADEPLVTRLRPKFTRPFTIDSQPAGAEVRVRYYDDPKAAPILLGKTPLTKFDYPKGFTRIELSLPGRRTVRDVIWNSGLFGAHVSYRLHGPQELPPEMEWVPGGSSPLFLPGLDDLKAEPTTAFLMDIHEVTQGEYRRFMEAGGYQNPRFWRQPFVDKNRELRPAEAMARFVDRTGRPGPASWEMGSYPDGGDSLPVGGVSWYEAAAYAEWAGKSLPTIFHWNRVAFPAGSSHIAPTANLNGKGPVPVGTTSSMNRFGVGDLAGNVREWVWNASSREGQRYILGGGWNDPDYGFDDAYAQPSFDRSPTNGFRCIRRLEPEPNSAALERVIEAPFRDFRAEKPVSNAAFAQLLRQFAYDRTPLDAKIEETKESGTGPRQKISFRAAYGGERMLAYLFLPPHGKPPYQVVIEFPGSGSIDIRSSDSLELGRLDFLPKSGRAVLLPVYKGTYERGGDLHSDYPAPTAFYRDYLVMWEKDLARSIDYIETRPDLDANRIAYYGLSWGGGLGATLPAVETRIKANVLYVAGLCFQRALPEVDEINYVGHVHQPTLMLNGELDFFFPLKTSQEPMFELLGTPPGQKERLIFPGGHSVPRTEQIKESLRWLDRYLGPVDSTPRPTP